MTIKRAILSVSDKTEITSLAKYLGEHNVEMYSSGGTYKTIKAAGISVKYIEELTDFPEILGGRVKTLNPKVASGILYRRDNSEDLKDMEKLNLESIDLVVCNLYPFEEKMKEGLTEEEMIEFVDIGGPTMIRSSAKNWKWVTVLTDPNQYKNFMQSYPRSWGETERKGAAIEAFKLTAHYDTQISQYFMREDAQLRYGENPHQKAWFFPKEVGLVQHSGKEMSYNNYLDTEAAYQAVADLRLNTNPNKKIVSVVKHTNPCGLAIGENQLDVLKKAWSGDPVSAFGGILCFGQTVTEAEAQWLGDKFIEIVIAPEFTTEALSILSKKKNRRLLTRPFTEQEGLMDRKSLSFGELVQELDFGMDSDFKVVTERNDPPRKELLEFGIIAGKHLKSNAIALVSEIDSTMFLTGAGMGNPNRLISYEQAVNKSKDNGYTQFDEMIMVSDAFFPFPDIVEKAAGENISWVVQPGGSIKDDDVVATCNANKMGMIFTGRRHFRH